MLCITIAEISDIMVLQISAFASFGEGRPIFRSLSTSAENSIHVELFRLLNHFHERLIVLLIFLLK